MCSAASWRALLESARALERLEVDFVPPMHEGAFEDLFGTVQAERRVASDGALPDGRRLPMGSLPNGGRGEGEEEVGKARRLDKGKGKARATDEDEAEGKGEGEYEEVPILPSLKQLRCGGIPSKEIVRLATHRRTFRSASSDVEGAFRIHRWEAEETFRDEDGIAFEEELARISEEAERVQRARGGRASEPWRWDEPLEKIVWYSVEGDYDDEDEDEDESDGGEEVGETEEDGDEDDD